MPIEVSGLPPNCTLTNSGQDKKFGTGDDGQPLAGPGGVLFNDVREYAAHQKVNFKFKMRLACSAPVPVGFVITLVAIVDHGADVYPAPDDEDLAPVNNTRTDTVKLTTQ